MQNVLLQMGLVLLSFDGTTTIQKLKQWVLRCHACFTIVRDEMNKIPLLFCAKCSITAPYSVLVPKSMRNLVVVAYFCPNIKNDQLITNEEPNIHFRNLVKAIVFKKRDSNHSVYFRNRYYFTTWTR